MNSWIYLVIAGICEVLWAVPLKISDGFTKLIPSILVIVFMILSLIFLELSLKDIPLGTAYACWTAIGVIGTVIAGIFLFNESISLNRIIFLLLIIIGICGLRLSSV